MTRSPPYCAWRARASVTSSTEGDLMLDEARAQGRHADVEGEQDFHGWVSIVNELAENRPVGCAGRAVSNGPGRVRGPGRAAPGRG